MAAALTIAALFMVSFIIVRIAAVAMRITGLPENVARFQCLSALTGAGFTTTESEMIVNYPVRRRIVAILMVLGNLGLISTSATLIVSFVETEQTTEAILSQAILFLGAIAMTLLILMNKFVDRIMCAVIGNLLRRTTSLGKRHAHRLLQLGDGYSVVEYVVRQEAGLVGTDLAPTGGPLTLLGVRREGSFRTVSEASLMDIFDGDALVYLGMDADHANFEDTVTAR